MPEPSATALEYPPRLSSLVDLSYERSWLGEDGAEHRVRISVRAPEGAIELRYAAFVARWAAEYVRRWHPDADEESFIRGESGPSRRAEAGAPAAAE